jgi:hypothetical protein
MLQELQQSHIIVIYTWLSHLQYYTCATPPIQLQSNLTELQAVLT